jgi:hypothetical protein
MKKALSVIALATLLIPAYSVFAQNKVVVIPMGSSAKGTNGQVQYNDNGATAGAEVYYDKATGKLELPGELRTVDGAGNNRLWGKGRPETGLFTHDVPNGYCTTSAGIKHALSSASDTWGNADDACPTGTWVCSLADLPTTGACPIAPLNTFSYILCDGTEVPAGGAVLSFQYGWVSNAYELSTFGSMGTIRPSDGWIFEVSGQKCLSMKVWCCWE